MQRTWLPEARKKAHVPRSMAAKLRNSYNKLKQLPMPDGITPADNKDEVGVYRADLFLLWVKSKQGKELKEIVDLENLAQLLKGDAHQRVFKKIAQNQSLTAEDLSYIKLYKEIIETLHRMKHGEKRINVNASLKDIREMMWGKHADSPGQ